MSRVRYLVWDWNGTLLDDTFACCAAVNEMLSVRGLPSIDLDFFRSRFAFPSRRFYDRKRGERLIHTQALLALARRLVDVLWALLRDDREFTLDTPKPVAAAA